MKTKDCINVFLHQLYILMLTCQPPSKTALAESVARLFVSSEPIQLFANTSFSVLIDNNVQWATQCAFQCLMINCSVASFHNASGLCEMIVLNSKPQADALSVNNVAMVIGAVAGTRVWKVHNFEQLLAANTITLSSTVYLNVTGTGRNGTVQSMLVTSTGCYYIEARGANGGTTYTGVPGGQGAKMAGSFNLTAGTALSIVVGQRGGNASQNDAFAGAGGGGGSFVYTSSSSTLLLAAGGGGGGSSNNNAGIDGQMSSNGTNSDGFASEYNGFGGTNGQAGIVNVSAATLAMFFGGAGAGWLNRSWVTQRTSQDALGGDSRADGWMGGLAGSLNAGAVGGFGGGGGGGTGCGGPGGGGGFSGGGAPVGCNNREGGGGSFCGGRGCNGVTGGNTDSDSGSVVIQPC